LGDIDITDLNGEFWQSVSPYELSFDVAYSRRLSETFQEQLHYATSDRTIRRVTKKTLRPAMHLQPTFRDTTNRI